MAGYFGSPPSVIDVLADVADERNRQEELWGEQNHPDGTGPQLRMFGVTSTWGNIADLARGETNRKAAAGELTYLDILLEKVAEAFAETDKAKLRTELIQVAAVATAWVEKLDREKA